MFSNLFYEFSVLNSGPEELVLGFESAGGSYKIIAFTFLEERFGRRVFNLGFGEFDQISGSVIDDQVFNKGDGRIILNTVLSSIPVFFSDNPGAALLVQGSDSTDVFLKNCLTTCLKNCGVHCKKYHRRIKIYCLFLDNRFEKLNKDYEFFGLKSFESTDVEQYNPGTFYIAVLIYKRSQ